MKFNKTLCNSVLQEWRFYSVDYKAMKKALKASPNGGIDHDQFFRLFELSKGKLDKFYHSKEKWAINYFESLQERVQDLRQTKVRSKATTTADEEAEVETNLVTSDSSSDSGNSSIASDSDDEASVLVDIGSLGTDMRMSIVSSSTSTNSVQMISPSSSSNDNKNNKFSWLKEQYRRVGTSKHFQNYIYAKKSLDTFARELDLVLEFLDLNYTAFSKILKKYDKINNSQTPLRQEKLTQLLDTHSYLEGKQIQKLKDGVQQMSKEVQRLKPNLPKGWEQRKVYTIGCFDLFHRGHQNVLMSLREFGYFIVAGIHDDESYFKLKNKYTIDNLETRMKNVKPFVDQLFVIPSTDPELYLKSMVSEQDIMAGKCCYARGDDMLQFPGREWVESVMPVHFVPRTESCSSTLIRTIYHADDPELRKKAAFADTRYDGKPIDENGNILKF